MLTLTKVKVKAMLDDQDEKFDGEIEKKIDVAEKQARKLSDRADVLRKLTEKYRDTSAEQIWGWEKLLQKTNTEEREENL
ncbi:hypothetical protein OKW21_002912 [Catalinimonas alkaloidigena]|uniref:hypothetical protein n=1 Tax=Catalinimonas alkaloidigena TaxID=1075417 RepID=UPI0024059799|nr:hypothetical protein [Catalinimonas alkaloidigena]MDF9797649.1 hypothetical protein [Catalinimonas alkaloidigena]